MENDTLPEFELNYFETEKISLRMLKKTIVYAFKAKNAQQQ